MPDWKKLVRERLSFQHSPRESNDDVVAELADHLEETYAQARSEGLSDDAALERSLQEVEDWPALAADIRRTKPQEDNMNHHTKTFWLPEIAILFGIGLLLVFLDRAASLQRFIWIGCMVMLLGTAASESNRLNQRTRSFWLPGLVSLTAATLFLFAADIVSDPFLFFSQITLHPQDLLANSGLRWFYFVWLLAQVLFGAVGARFSRRAGGTRTSRIVAGGLPAIIFVGTYVALIPFTSMFSGNAAISPLPTFLASSMFVWVAAPALALLSGAAPFLKETEPRRAWN